MSTPDFFRTRLADMIDLRHPLAVLTTRIPWRTLDRITIQRFLGLKSSGRIPDSKTIWAYQQDLMNVGAAPVIATAVQQQLAVAGYLARNGQLIDASIIHAPVQHFTKEEKTTLDRGEIPADWSPAKRAQKDLDAKWTKKHGKSYHGYKAHTSADVRHKLVRKCAVTHAAVHDTNHFEDLLDETNTSREVSADKSYVDGAREARLTKAGWRVMVQRKAKPGKKLGARQKGRNTTIARVRSRIEHVFAGLNQMGGELVRTIGLKRAEFQITLKMAAYNLKRWVSMRKCGITPFLHREVASKNLPKRRNSTR